MIQIGVYGVGSRISARRKVSFFIAAILACASMATIEEGMQRRHIARVERDVVVPEAGERLALHRTFPQAREALRMARGDQLVGFAHEDQRGHGELWRMRGAVERMAH